jgi:hypothetical protein
MRTRDQCLDKFTSSGNSARALPRIGSWCLEAVNSCARTFTWETRPLEGNSEIVFAPRGYARLGQAPI